MLNDYEILCENNHQIINSFFLISAALTANEHSEVIPHYQVVIQTKV